MVPVVTDAVREHGASPTNVNPSLDARGHTGVDPYARRAAECHIGGHHLAVGECSLCGRGLDGQGEVRSEPSPACGYPTSCPVPQQLKGRYPGTGPPGGAANPTTIRSSIAGCTGGQVKGEGEGQGQGKSGCFGVCWQRLGGWTFCDAAAWHCGQLPSPYVAEEISACRRDRSRGCSGTGTRRSRSGPAVGKQTSPGLALPVTAVAASSVLILILISLRSASCRGAGRAQRFLRRHSCFAKLSPP